MTLINKIISAVCMLAASIYPIIGSWDNSNNVFLISGGLESTFRTADANTGVATIYNGPSAGDGDTATLTNMASGYGYVYNSGDAYYKFDNVDDYMLTTYDIDLTPASTVTFSFDFVYTDIATYQVLIGRRTDALVDFEIRIGTTDQIQWYTAYTSKTTTTISSIETLTNGNQYNIVATKSGTTIAFYINGTPATYVSSNQTYATDTASYVNLGIGSRISSPLAYSGRLDAVAVYSDAKSAAWVSQTYGLGLDLGGLVGEDNGDGTMDIVPNKNLHQNRYFRFGNSFAEWSKRVLRLR